MKCGDVFDIYNKNDWIWSLFEGGLSTKWEKMGKRSEKWHIGGKVDTRGKNDNRFLVFTEPSIEDPHIDFHEYVLV